MKRVLTDRSRKDRCLIPTIAILDMDAAPLSYMAQYRFRLAFAFFGWRVSIGLGRDRWKKQK